MGDLPRVAIMGAAGRMGKALTAAISSSDQLRLTVALERPDSGLVGQDVGVIAGTDAVGVTISDSLIACLADFDVLIDFTIAAATAANVAVCREHGKAMVIGTTGLSDMQLAELTDAASDIAIVKAHNFSVGVNVTFKLAEIAARILGDGVDIEISETHHRHKVDSPSGTAIGLGEVIAGALGRDLADVAVYGRQGLTGARDDMAIGFHSIRAGEIIGEHTVMFASEGERIELTHKAQSRTNFADGAVRSATWVAGRSSGLFDMQDVLGLRDGTT